jgi:hypothetical protein
MSSSLKGTTALFRLDDILCKIITYARTSVLVLIYMKQLEMRIQN